mmetsp:Transcript_1708/g.6016  ORF Transcript_1708/g.6016 Transcript_1708/m.6016 type:complete len:251 (+) Transcript_1708:172-924(+)
MIHFYCEKKRQEGLRSLLRAASLKNADAMHALAIIHFNGSGGQRKDKDLARAAALCEAAGALGHTNALRELGHCLQDGYGVQRDIKRGRHLIQQANMQEVSERKRADSEQEGVSPQNGDGSGVDDAANRTDPVTLSRGSSETNDDFELDVSSCKDVLSTACDPAHAFLVSWFQKHPPPTAFRMCSHAACGRPETRRHEFRRCSACGKVNYCSRACQALDWKIRHRQECTPLGVFYEWEEEGDEEDVGAEE